MSDDTAASHLSRGRLNCVRVAFSHKNSTYSGGALKPDSGLSEQGVKKPEIRLKGLVKDVYIKEFRYFSTSRHPRMPRRGLTGPEMKFLNVF